MSGFRFVHRMFLERRLVNLLIYTVRSHVLFWSSWLISSGTNQAEIRFLVV
jgi:hypothetical protein